MHCINIHLLMFKLFIFNIKFWTFMLHYVYHVTIWKINQECHYLCVTKTYIFHLNITFNLLATQLHSLLLYIVFKSYIKQKSSTDVLSANFLLCNFWVLFTLKSFHKTEKNGYKSKNKLEFHSHPHNAGWITKSIHRQSEYPQNAFMCKISICVHIQSKYI